MREIINSRRENIWVITCFWGASGFFGGASGFSDSLAPRASGCHSPMSRPAIVPVYERALIEGVTSYMVTQVTGKL